MLPEKLKMLFSDLRDLRRMPRVTINLAAAETATNDPFYATLVEDFYRYVRRRHPRFPLIRAFEFGVALCTLPASGEAYMAAIEASGRRNVRKAQRLGYEFRRIQFNDHLQDIGAIRHSTDRRQGEITGYLLDETVEPCRDPPSRSRVHDYVYYGVFKEGRLLAYGGCLISGELCMVEHILGHADYLADGIVPLLLVGMADDAARNYPRVRYFAYGTFFGGGSTMRRFKKKFQFLPHRVIWKKE